MKQQQQHRQQLQQKMKEMEVSCDIEFSFFHLKISNNVVEILQAFKILMLILWKSVLQQKVCTHVKAM